MADCMAFCPVCIEAAARDRLFSPWAVAHGLGFDFARAWEGSGAEFWTAPDLDFLNFYDARFADGRRMPDEPDADGRGMCKASLLELRNLWAQKVARYYAAYCLGIPPECSAAKPLTCDCL